MAHIEKHYPKVLDRRLRQQDLNRWITDMADWNYFVTIPVTPAHPLRADELERLARHWSARFERALLGQRWFKCPEDSRVRILGFVEGGPKSGSLHSHMLVDVPRPRLGGFWSVAEEAWHLVQANALAKRPLDIRPIGPMSDDIRRVAAYATKNTGHQAHYESFFIIP